MRYQLRHKGVAPGLSPGLPGAFALPDHTIRSSSAAPRMRLAERPGTPGPYFSDANASRTQPLLAGASGFLLASSLRYDASRRDVVAGTIADCGFKARFACSEYKARSGITAKTTHRMGLAVARLSGLSARLFCSQGSALFPGGIRLLEPDPHTLRH